MSVSVVGSLHLDIIVAAARLPHLALQMWW